jgi:High potential iron-sulfur protein
MSNPSRRTFMMSVVAGGAALGATRAMAQAAGQVTESDPQATALGYKADTTKVDPAKFPKHEATQMCGGCQLFQGKAGEASGPCQLFAGRQVSSKGWCSAWVKKA